ncbi:bifunctional DNA primase/polymerase [Limosilactobacillus reuteri]|uniref:bifunctional DNA primase/polymerase n=1 Tax=Limosilactobacillus reuteri TaxID=1598 RepID=UPI0024BB5833|nr:bifunctional DNA primase/polymerase [Limosilactobacillus reuteri]
MNNTFNVAQSLAENGIKVYPLSPGSKIPVASSHGEHDATNNPDTIKSWFNYNPNFNLAINLQASGLAVIDLDKHNNTTDGVQNYSKYLLNHGNNYMDSLKTYTELTPRGGVHIFYKLNHDLGNKDIQLMPGVELLTGKVTIAPSFIDKFNKGYIAQYQGYQTLSRENVQPLPDWIIELATEAQQHTTKPAAQGNYQPGQKRWTGRLLDELVHGAPKGDRNNYLTQLTGKMFHVGADSDSIYNLLAFANSNCEPPLPDNEINSIFGSILKKNGGH